MPRKANAQTIESNSQVNSLATLDEELKNLGSNPLYDTLLKPIRTHIQTELNKALNQLKSDLVSDVSNEIDKALQPIFTLINKLPSKFLQDALKTKIHSFINNLKTELTANNN